MGIGPHLSLIQTRQLTKTFVAGNQQAVHALGPLDIDIFQGEFVCIVGPSGCGKSTFLRLIAGLDEPSSGQLTIKQPDVQDPAETSRADRPFNNLVFQGDSTFPWLTVHGNVEYGLRVRGVALKEREATVARMLKTVGLSGFAEAYPYQLSGGMRQRVALARALANNPLVLLMDEPFGALDAQNRTLLQDELLQIWEAPDAGNVDDQGVPARRTIVFVTHSIEEAIVLSDRVLVMSAAPGRIKSEVVVPFARPRRAFELRREPEFGELTYEIWESLRDEVNAARKAEVR